MKTRFVVRLAGIVSALAALVVGASAQGQRSITLGEPIVGEISPDTPAQIYTLPAAAGDAVNIGLTSQPGLVLSFVVTDSTGTQLAAASDTSGSGSVSALNITLAEGVNIIAIFASIDSVERIGQYRLLVETAGETPAPAETSAPDATSDAPAATPEPVATTAPATDVSTDATDGFQLGQVLTTTGLQVQLDWLSTADLNLEVRDPFGERLFFDSRTNQNGGTFGFDVNGLCEVLNSPATETATYAPGAVPVGSYEVLVYYRQDCQNNGPQPFSVTITVDGVQLPVVNGTLTPPVNGASTVFVTSFVVNTDGTASAGAAGAYPDVRTIPSTLQAALDSAPRTALTDGIPSRGVINGDRYFDLYSFDGVANQVVSLSLTRVSGSLDTLLLVLDPSGSIIADSDDIVAGNVTDSAINNPPLRLPVDGQYTIVATRYGKNVGGTAGEYDLLVQTQTTALPQEVVDLGLPTGDIQVTLVWNTNADLQLLVRDPSGQSVYDDQLTVPSGGRMFAQGNVNCTTSLTTPVSHIYWPTGLGRGGSYEVEVWYQNQCSDTRTVNATLYISVAGQQIGTIPVSPNVNGRFVTSFVIEPTGVASLGEGGIIGGSETLDFAGELESAPSLLPNQVVRGTISADNKFDVYTFNGEAGQVVDVRMERTQGSLDTSLFLISPSLFEVAANDDAVIGTTTDSLIDGFTLPESGRYVVLATHFATIYGGTTGTYQLSYSVE